MTLWTKARCGWLRRVRDRGPLRVIFGGPHTSLPSLVNLRVGDTIFPVWICDGQLRVIAGMQMGQLITLSEYVRDHLHMECARLPVGPIGHEFPEQHTDSKRIADSSLIGSRTAYRAWSSRALGASSKLPLDLKVLRLISSGASLLRICRCLGLAPNQGRQNSHRSKGWTPVERLQL